MSKICCQIFLGQKCAAKYKFYCSLLFKMLNYYAYGTQTQSHYSLCLSTRTWHEIVLKCIEKITVKNMTSTWKLDLHFLVFFFPSRYSSPFNRAQQFIHHEWLFIWHFQQRSLQPSQKKVKGVFPKCSSEKIKHSVIFDPRRQIIMRGNPEWRSLCYFLLRSQWVISLSLQNNKKKLVFNRAVTYTVQRAGTGRLNCILKWPQRPLTWKLLLYT